MNAKQKLRQIRLNKWIARFADQKTSGLTVQQWCDQNNFTIHTYNYWKHILKKEVVEQVLPDIVPLSRLSPIPESGSSILEPITTQSEQNRTNCAIRTNRSTAKLSAGDMAIEVDSSVSGEFLRTLIKAVCYAYE